MLLLPFILSYSK